MCPWVLVVSFIRARWLNKLRPAAPHEGGRAGGPDSTYRDHWCFQVGEKLHFSRVILALGAMLIFSASFNGKKPRIVRVILVSGYHANLLSHRKTKNLELSVSSLRRGPC